MRILALTNLYPNPYQPHLAAFNRLQFRALAARHPVQVIAPIAWTGEWQARRGGAPAGLGNDRKRIMDGMIVHHPHYAFTPKVLRGWYGTFFLESVRECFEEAVRSFRPEVVLGCWAYPDGWAAVRLAREAGLPVAIKVHGSDVLTLDEHSARFSKTTDALTAADAVVTVSRNLAAGVAALGVDPARIHTVYNGVDTSMFCPGARGSARRELGIDSHDPLILFVGNLVPVKGLDVLINALAGLAGRGQRFRAALVGEGPLREHLKAQIGARGLSDRVRLIGARPQSELPLWYRAATLLVLPSRSEGVPNVMLEAAACGTPCVASLVGGIPEVADPDMLVTPDDPIALSERIRMTLCAPDRLGVPPIARPSSWSDSAGSLATVLHGIVETSSLRVAAAG